MPGLWCHKWHPLQFRIIIDNFDILKKYHGIQLNMAGDQLAGITIKWDYLNRCCRLSMPGYINNLLTKFKHPHPRSPQCSPHKCLPISMVPRHNAFLKQILWNFLMTLASNAPKKSWEHSSTISAVDKKLLVALSAIAARQAKSRVATEQAVNLLLDYVSTYPNGGIIY